MFLSLLHVLIISEPLHVAGISPLRMIHIVDSMVVAAVITKGRSSSKILIRTLRRMCAVVIVADLYILPLWTLSGWNFADTGSRMFRPPS